MHIVRLKKLFDFAKSHANTRKSLIAWKMEVLKAQ
jgi:mRNA-degrading endonuclease HigB of HigAB toxin-antitoxin module